MSPKAERFVESAAVNLGELIKAAKVASFQEAAKTAVENADYQSAAKLAEFLANPNFHNDLAKAGIEASDILNRILKKYGVSDLDIEFPFTEVENQRPQRQLGASSEDKSSKLTSNEGKERDLSLSLSLRVLHALIEQNDDKTNFRYDRSKIIDAVLSEEEAKDNEARNKVSNTYFANRKQLADRITEWANGVEEPKMSQFVIEYVKKSKKRRCQSFLLKSLRTIW